MSGVKEKAALPKSVKAVLWSYDTEKIDTERDKNLIIKNILDFGTMDAFLWMLERYSKQEIKKAINNTYESEWASKKSLNFAIQIFKALPKRKRRIE